MFVKARGTTPCQKCRLTRQAARRETGRHEVCREKKLVGRRVLSVNSQESATRSCGSMPTSSYAGFSCMYCSTGSPGHDATTGCLPIASGVRRTCYRAAADARRQDTLAVTSRRSLLVADRVGTADHAGTLENATDFFVVRAVEAAFDAVPGGRRWRSLHFPSRDSASS